MGLSASQGRMLLLTARKNDLEFRAQQISQRRLVLSSQLEQISTDYEEAMSNRVMHIKLMDASGETNSNKEYNLSYAALVSGTVYSAANGDASQYGIVASDLTGTNALIKDKVYATTNYRLVNADGYIVVADEDEIPKGEAKSITKETEFIGTSLETTNDYDIKEGESEKPSDNSEEIVFLKDGTAIQYNLMTEEEKGNLLTIDGKYQKLNFKNDKDKDSNDVKGLTHVKSKVNGTERSIYSMTGNNKFTTRENEIINSKTIVDKTEDSGITNPNIHVIEIEGKRYHYLVDPSLKNDSIANNSGENYLQECLRNGLYSIQKGTVDANDEDNDGDLVEWRDISWDSATSIYDQYYDDDDAAAKAKYDRLQTQIQNQDKKLELELNNIETQRSAVTTEVESVQKVIDDNVDSTFKTFA